MKITPLEIRQKTFEKGFRGYEKEEVQAYLQSLSQEWEKMMDENKEFRMKKESLEKEVEKLREVESSLYKTLKTAEDTGANIMDQASKMAELHMKEAEMNAESILNDAKTKSRDTIEEAEVVARQTIEEMESQLKNLIHTFKTLENFRDDLIADIKGLASDAQERVDRLKGQIKRVDIEGQFMSARRESKKVMDDRYSENDKTKKQQSNNLVREIGKGEEKEKENENEKGKENENESESTKTKIEEAPIEDRGPVATENKAQEVKEENKPVSENNPKIEEKKQSGSFFDDIQ